MHSLLIRLDSISDTNDDFLLLTKALQRMSPALTSSDIGASLGKDTAPANKGHPTPTTLAHVVLRTTANNYQPMIAFYMRLLNATITHASPNITFLRYDEEHHRIAILQTPEVVPKREGVIHSGLDHIAFTYSSLTALARTYRSLKLPPADCTSYGDNILTLLPIWSVNHGPTTSLYYRDPDFNKVELQVDNFDTAEAADAFMSGKHFEVNPIGTDFDPDVWADQILTKVDADGNEGLTRAEVREMKTRHEIGERPLPPEGF